MCHGQWLDSHWAGASTGRGRIACGGGEPIEPCHALQHAILLSTANVPQQTIYNSQNWYMWFYGRYFCDCILCWLFADSCPRCSTGLCGAPFGPAWELIEMTLVSLMPLSSASAYDILCSSSRGSSRWPVFVVSGDLQLLGALSKAEIMETMYVISLWSMFPDRILLTDWDWSIVPWCRLWWAVVLLDWRMTLNSLPQMISAKGYGCITLAKFDVLFISRFRIAFAWQLDVM